MPNNTFQSDDVVIVVSQEAGSSGLNRAILTVGELMGDESDSHSLKEINERVKTDLQGANFAMSIIDSADADLPGFVESISANLARQLTEPSAAPAPQNNTPPAAPAAAPPLRI